MVPLAIGCPSSLLGLNIPCRSLPSLIRSPACMATPVELSSTHCAQTPRASCLGSGLQVSQLFIRSRWDSCTTETGCREIVCIFFPCEVWYLEPLCKFVPSARCINCPHRSQVQEPSTCREISRSYPGQFENLDTSCYWTFFLLLAASRLYS